MLRYSTLGTKIILGVFALLTAAALYLPFLEAFALTPAIAFIHRFSITLNIGSDTKTLQPIVFIIPILLIKGLWEYHKKYGIVTLLKSKLTLIIAILFAVDIVSIITSTSRSASIGSFIVHAMNWAIFITSTLWLTMVADFMKSEKVRKVGIKLLSTFFIALAIFSITNTAVSVSQFADCAGGCTVWNKIDAAFPNKLLLVGHQKFSWKPMVIRAPGFFGDVNFNGMFSLFVALITIILLVSGELLKTKNGYTPVKEARLLVITLICSIISFVLTLSRSAMVGAGVTGLVVAFVYLVPLIKKYSIPAETAKRIGLFLLVSLVAAGMLFGAGFLVPMTYNSRKTTLSKELVTYVKDMFNPEEDSAQGHASLFESALKIGNQNPIFGMGIGTFGAQYSKVIEANSDNANPHSTYGMLYAEQGLVGLLAYIGIIGYLWISAIRAGRKATDKIIEEHSKNKKLSRESYLNFLAAILLSLIGFGIPFFSIATISYYGFFLPMVWWWGNKELVRDLTT